MTPPARLIRLHRHVLSNVLVLGGTGEQRLQIAYAFHRESRVGQGPFVCVDGATEEARLRSSLESRMSSIVPGTPADPLRMAEQGTLFLDSVASLSMDTQRMLLAVLLRCDNAPQRDHGLGWTGRLMAGNPESLDLAVDDGRFSATLFDTLDKVRIELAPLMEEHVA